MEYRTGDVIGAYRLLEQCGKGSFGQVFLAENLFSGQTVALKLLTETGKAMQKELDGLIRFRSCRHPNLLPILHIDKVDNHLDCPMACYPSWSEIAGMEVVVEKDIVITPQELVAGLLWEITYFGGTEEIARKNMERTFHGGTK